MFFFFFVEGLLVGESFIFTVANNHDKRNRSVRRVLMAVHHQSWDLDVTWLHARVPGGG